MTPTFKPTKYELAIAGRGSNKETQLRLYAHGLQVAFSVIGGCRYKNGNSLPGLRKEGRKMSRLWNVPFVDLTV